MAEKKAAEEAAREAARKNPKPDPFKAKPFESKDRDLLQKDVGAPAEKSEKDVNAICLSDDPVVLEFVLLSHIVDVLFHKIIDVLAEEVHIMFG